MDEVIPIPNERTEPRPRKPSKTTEGVTLAEATTSVTPPVERLKPSQTDLDEQWLGEEINIAAGTVIRFDDPSPVSTP